MSVDVNILSLDQIATVVQGNGKITQIDPYKKETSVFDLLLTHPLCERDLFDPKNHMRIAHNYNDLYRTMYDIRLLSSYIDSDSHNPDLQNKLTEQLNFLIKVVEYIQDDKVYYLKQKREKLMDVSNGTLEQKNIADIDARIAATNLEISGPRKIHEDMENAEMMSSPDKFSKKKQIKIGDKIEKSLLYSPENSVASQLSIMSIDDSRDSVEQSPNSYEPKRTTTWTTKAKSAFQRKKTAKKAARKTAKKLASKKKRYSIAKNMPPVPWKATM